MNEDVKAMLHNKTLRNFHYVETKKASTFRFKKATPQYLKDKRDENVANYRRRMSY